MKKNLIIVITLLMPLFAFPQARLVLNGSVFVKLYGGTASGSGAYLVLDDSATNAITQLHTDTGWIVSEKEFNMVKWDIKANTGSYYIPFYDSTDSYYIPYTLGIGTAGTTSGSINFSTWHTLRDNDNVAFLPSDDIWLNFGNPDDTAYTVDRFWVIDASSYGTKPTPDSMDFYYAPAEMTLKTLITESNLRAQRFNDISANGHWGDMSPIGADATGTYHVVTPGISTANFFKDWTLTDDTSPLPITLLNFAATCNGSKVNINWETVSEINNHFFTVQKSHDGIEFNDLTTIPGAGNSNSPLLYSAVDNAPYSDITYYRLKQTDFNGNYTYSSLSIAQCGTDDFYIVKLYPNQVSQNTTLLFNADFDGPYNVSVYDVLGNHVINLNNSAVKGPNQVVMDFSSLAHSVYLVRIGNSAKSITRKIVY